MSEKIDRLLQLLVKKRVGLTIMELLVSARDPAPQAQECF